MCCLNYLGIPFLFPGTNKSYTFSCMEDASRPSISAYFCTGLEYGVFDSPSSCVLLYRRVIGDLPMLTHNVCVVDFLAAAVVAIP
jgi:hypothetical protein